MADFLQAILHELLPWMKQRWHQRSSLVLLILLIVVAGLVLSSLIDISKISWQNVALITLLAVAGFIFWLSTTRIKKAAPNTIGFVVAIATEDKAYRARITSDFYDALRRALTSGQTETHRYTFLIADDYHARQIVDHPAALAYAVKARAHFILYGRAGLREIAGQEQHLIRLHGTVLHNRLEDAVKKKLVHEFTELLPQILQVTQEQDFLAFEISASVISVVAQYIIGIAGLLSGNIDLAESQFEAVEAAIPKEGKCLPPLDKIRQRLPIRLAEVWSVKASLLGYRWRNDGNVAHLVDAKRYLDRCERYDPNNYRMLLCLGIYYFVVNRDIKAASQALKRCGDLNIKDGTWRFSYAFLKAYSGDYQQALNQYKLAFRSRYAESIPMQVESFMLSVLEEEPEKIGLHFCLGLVNFEAKGDRIRAAEEFRTFLTKAADNKSFKTWRGLAQNYLARIARAEEGDTPQK